MSQEENLPTKEIQEPEEEEEDIGLDSWLVNNLTVSLSPLQAVIRPLAMGGHYLTSSVLFLEVVSSG